MEGSNISLVLFVGTVFILLIALIAFAITYAVEMRSKRMEAKQTIKTFQDYHREEMFKAQIDIQEKTIQNISLEIHDNVGQLLSLAKLNLNTLAVEPNLINDPKLGEARDLITKSIGILRTLSKTFNSDTIARCGLIKGIQLQLNLIEKAGDIRTHFSYKSEIIDLPDKEQLIIFRIVQEALNNVIKHAGASEISVETVEKKDSYQISVRDNGKGFDESLISETNGLMNMKKRATAIDAEFRIDSFPNNGTVVTVDVKKKVDDYT